MASANDTAILAKYRATPRFEDALKIIDPNRREQCEYELASALWGIEHAAKMDKFKSVRTPAQHRKDLEKLSKALRTALKHAPKAFPFEYRIRRDPENAVPLDIEEELKRHLRETEQAINWTRERARKGSPAQSYARITAVDAAFFCSANTAANRRSIAMGLGTNLLGYSLGTSKLISSIT